MHSKGFPHIMLASHSSRSSWSLSGRYSPDVRRSLCRHAVCAPLYMAAPESETRALLSRILYCLGLALYVGLGGYAALYVQTVDETGRRRYAYKSTLYAGHDLALKYVPPSWAGPKISFRICSQVPDYPLLTLVPFPCYPWFHSPAKPGSIPVIPVLFITLVPFLLSQCFL